MVQLNFDASQVEPSKPFTLLPPGRYVCKIIDSKIKETSKKDGNYLELTHEVLDGEHTGVTFQNNLNIDNPNVQTTEIAYKTLSSICHAVGKIKIKDSSELHGLPLVATLAVRAYTKQDNTQGSSNDVKGYEAATADSKSTSSATTATAPASGQAAAAAQPAAQTGKPAWAQKKTA